MKYPSMAGMVVWFVILCTAAYAVQAPQKEVDFEKVIADRWQAETVYRDSARTFWKAYKRADEAYRKVKETGADLKVLREASSFSDAMARQIAGQIQENAACTAVAAVAPTASVVCDSQKAFDLAKWFAVDLAIVPSAIKNRIIIARELKPASEAMNKAQGVLQRVQQMIQKHNAGGLRISSPVNGQVTWDTVVSGSAAPRQKIRVYIFTDRSYLQGEAVADHAGKWKVSTYPTAKAENVVYAVSYDTRGRARAYSGEHTIPAKWRQPREK